MEDGPTTFAYLTKNPEIFKNDIYERIYAVFQGASLQNWPAAIMYKTFNISPVYISYFYIFAQNIFLFVTIYFLSLALFEEVTVAWLTAIFLMMTKLHLYNLGLLGDLYFVPYAMFLALPLIVLAALNCIKGSILTSVFLLLLAGLIHPTLGAEASFMLGTYLIALRWQNSSSKAIDYRKIFLFGLVILANLLPATILTRSPDALPVPRFFIEHDAHFFPSTLGGDDQFFALFTRFIIIYVSAMGLACIAVFKNKSLGKQKSTFWYSIFLSSAFLVLVHLLFLQIYKHFDIPQLIQIFLIRATALSLLFSVPFIVKYFYDRVKDGPLPMVLMILFFSLASYSYSIQYHLLFFLIFISALLDLTFEKLALRQRKILNLSVTAAAALFTLIAYFGAHERPDGHLATLFSLRPVRPEIYPGLALAFSALITMAFFIWRRKLQAGDLDGEGRARQGYSFAKSLAVIFFALYCLLSTNKASGLRVDQRYRDLFSAQKYARENLPADAEFILSTATIEGWRSFSGRPVISANYVGVVYAYGKLADDYNHRLFNFYAEVFKTDKDRPKDVWQAMQREWGQPDYSRLTTKDVERFARIFGGDFIVKLTSDRPLDLAVEYQNKTFTIYRLNKHI